MKQIILFANNNPIRTLLAIAAGITTGVFNSGWLAIVLAVVAVAAVLLIPSIAKSYEYNTYSWYSNGWKRYGLLIAGATCATVLAGIAIYTIGLTFWWIAVSGSVALTIVTAWAALGKGIDSYLPFLKNFNWVIWCLFVGGVLLIATLGYASFLMATGSEFAALKNDTIIQYGACGGGFLVAIFLITLIVSMVVNGWQELVDWAKH